MANKLPIYLKGATESADTFIKNLKVIYNDGTIEQTDKNETLVAGHKLSYQSEPSSPVPSYVAPRDTRYDFPVAEEEEEASTPTPPSGGVGGSGAATPPSGRSGGRSGRSGAGTPPSGGASGGTGTPPGSPGASGAGSPGA